MPVVMQGVSLVAGARPFVAKRGSGFLPVFQIHLRIFAVVGATGALRFFLATPRSRLIYAGRLRADYSTSARLYLVINHRLARSHSPVLRRTVCDRSTDVRKPPALDTHAFRDKTPRGIAPTFIERSPVPRRASFNPHRGGLIWNDPAFREHRED